MLTERRSQKTHKIHKTPVGAVSDWKHLSTSLPFLLFTAKSILKMAFLLAWAYQDDRKRNV